MMPVAGSNSMGSLWGRSLAGAAPAMLVLVEREGET